MKKYLVFLSAAALMLAGCTKEMEFSKADNSSAPVFTATISAQTPDVKSSLASDGAAINWAADDEIRVFSATNTAGAKFKATGVDGKVAYFAIEDGETWTDGDEGPYWAAYPATATFDGSALNFAIPAEQTYAEGSFAKDANPEAAYSTTTKLNFKNVCGLMKINVYSTTGAAVKKVTLSDEAGLSGTVAVTMGTDGTVSATTPTLSGKQVTVTAAEAATVGASSSDATAFYAVVPADAFASKVTVNVEDADGNALVRTSTSTANKVARAQITNMPAFDFAPFTTKTWELVSNAGYANGPVKVKVADAAASSISDVKVLFDDKEATLSAGVYTGSMNVIEDGTAYGKITFKKGGATYSQQIPVELTNWYYEIGDLLQEPVVTAGVQNVAPVFSPDGSVAYYPTWFKNLIAVDIASKSIKWQTNSSLSLIKSDASQIQPVVNRVNGDIYMNSNLSDANNVAYIINPEDGTLKCRSTLGILNGTGSGPGVSDDGKVVFWGTTGATVRAMSAETLDVEGAFAVTKFCALAVKGNTCVIIGDSNECNYGLYDASADMGSRFTKGSADNISGSGVTWTKSAQVGMSPDGTKVYIPSASVGRVGIFDISAFTATHNGNSGSVNPYNFSAAWSPIVDKDGYIYMSFARTSGKGGGVLCKFSPNDLQNPLWMWEVPEATTSWNSGLNRCNPVIDEDGNLYILSREDGNIYKINGQTGEGEVFANAPSNVTNTQYSVNLYKGYLIVAYSGAGSSAGAGSNSVKLCCKYVGKERMQSWSSSGGTPWCDKNWKAAYGK